MHTYADEILSVDTLLFITAALFSYLSLRRNRFRLTEIIADFSFFAGMIIMLSWALSLYSLLIDKAFLTNTCS